MSQDLSIEAKIKKEMGENDEELVPEEFSNLILDTIQIKGFTTVDQEFLNKFTNCNQLAMNNCHLQSLANIPEKMPLESVSAYNLFILFT